MYGLASWILSLIYILVFSWMSCMQNRGILDCVISCSLANQMIQITADTTKANMDRVDKAPIVCNTPIYLSERHPPVYVVEVVNLPRCFFYPLPVTIMDVYKCSLLPLISSASLSHVKTEFPYQSYCETHGVMKISRKHISITYISMLISASLHEIPLKLDLAKLLLIRSSFVVSL